MAAASCQIGRWTFGQPIEQEFLRGAGARARRAGLARMIAAVGAQIPRVAIVVEIGLEPFVDDRAP